MCILPVLIESNAWIAEFSVPCVVVLSHLTAFHLCSHDHWLSRSTAQDFCLIGTKPGLALWQASPQAFIKHSYEPPLTEEHISVRFFVKLYNCVSLVRVILCFMLISAEKLIRARCHLRTNMALRCRIGDKKNQECGCNKH